MKNFLSKFLKKKKKTLSYAEQLESIKSVFTEMYNKAKGLVDAINLDVDIQNQMIESTKKRIESLQSQKANAEAFMNKMKEFA